MGLDMYLVAREKDEQLHYWRKHNALHDWMAKEAIRQKIVETEADFNCVHLLLSEETLNRLEAAVKSKSLSPTDGFFFGVTDYDPFEEYGKEDLAAIQKARDAIAEGKDVYYTSWW